MNYYKRPWEESTGDLLTDKWGKSIFYLEVDSDSIIIRQMQVFENGKVLKYSSSFLHDDFGGLADQPLENEAEEFAEFKIDKNEFETVWEKSIHNARVKSWWKFWSK